MAKVLVDTSAWIEFFRHPQSTAATVVEHLLDQDAVCTTGIVLAELLHGTQSPKEGEMLITKFHSLDYLELTFGLFAAAGQMASALRRRGITLPLSDLLVAAVAEAHGSPIYTLDAHFNRVPNVHLYRP